MGVEFANPAKPGAARSTRFPSDPNAIAQLTLNFSAANSESFTGLVKNESKTGCCLVLVTARKFPDEVEGICKVGDLPYSKCRLRWSKKISKRVVEIGLRYLP